ncbi:hypothetical protein RFI_38843, partial [Reticulomyxa filosa]
MRTQGNLWQNMWNESPALEAMEQEMLFDFDVNGNQVIKWLHNLQPKYVLTELCQIALGNVLAIFERTPGMEAGLDILRQQQHELVHRCQSLWIKSHTEPHTPPPTPFASGSNISPPEQKYSSPDDAPLSTQPHIDLKKTLDCCR